MAWVRFPDGSRPKVERAEQGDAEHDLTKLLALRAQAGAPGPRRERLALFGDVIGTWLEAGCPTAAPSKGGSETRGHRHTVMKSCPGAKPIRVVGAKGGSVPRTTAAIGLSTILLTAALVLTPSTAWAGSKTSPDCIIGGANLNEIYGTDDGFVVDPFCTEVATGARWRPILRWNVAGSWEFVPDGFVPAGETPLGDFLLKFEGARYVVDAGTRQEREYIFSAEDLSLVAADLPDGWDFATWTPRMHPLAPGTHTVDKYTIFSAAHCDGIPEAEGGICASAGEHFAESVEFLIQ